MSQAAAWLAALALALALISASAWSGPWLLLPACCGRRARKRYRDMRGGRHRQASGRVPALMRAAVFRADRHRCVACGRRGQKDRKGKWRGLAADHYVPWLLGGLTALINMTTLCRSCNSVKSCLWVSPAGTVYYRGRRRPPQRAFDILAAEARARRNPLRWGRALGLLPV